MDVSEDDLALVNALQISPRIPWVRAGEILGAHPTTLASRWDRLRSAGVAWVTAHLVGAPDQMSLSFHDIECELSRRRSVLARICAIPEVVSVEESARNRDMMLTVITPSLAHLDRTVIPQLTGIDGLTKCQTSMATKLYADGHAWRLNVLTRSQQGALSRDVVRPAAAPGPLPPSYWPIIQMLARDGRATVADIARHTGAHPATARRQLNRVLDGGTLSFRCELAQAYTGLPVSCQWFARVPAGKHEQAAEAMKTFRNLRLCVSTTGMTNFIFVLWLRTVADVMTAERTIVERVPGIELIESAITLNHAKRVGWLLNPDSTATGEVIIPPLPSVLG